MDNEERKGVVWGEGGEIGRDQTTQDLQMLC